MPEVGPVHLMPSFTVLIPHYSEKITLSLREIIREEEQYSHVTMLEYLKLLHPLEWSCFVKDTKLLAEEFETDSSSAEIKKRNLMIYRTIPSVQGCHTGIHSSNSNLGITSLPNTL